MSKTVPTKAMGPPGRPALPPEAEAEIMEKLFSNMKISSGEIAAILARHGVSGDGAVLQEQYRKRLGQRLTAASTSWWSAATISRPSRPSAAASRAR